MELQETVRELSEERGHNVIAALYWEATEKVESYRREYANYGKTIGDGTSAMKMSDVRKAGRVKARLDRLIKKLASDIIAIDLELDSL